MKPKSGRRKRRSSGYSEFEVNDDQLQQANAMDLQIEKENEKDNKLTSDDEMFEKRKKLKKKKQKSKPKVGTKSKTKTKTKSKTKTKTKSKSTKKTQAKNTNNPTKTRLNKRNQHRPVKYNKDKSNNGRHPKTLQLKMNYDSTPEDGVDINKGTMDEKEVLKEYAGHFGSVKMVLSQERAVCVLMCFTLFLLVFGNFIF